MKPLYKRKLFFILFFILIIYRTLHLPYYNSYKPLSKEGTPRSILIQDTSATTAFTFPKLQFDFEHGSNSHTNGMLGVFISWKFILASLFILKVILIDKRKRIITLITRYFEGSKYKNSFSFLH